MSGKITIDLAGVQTRKQLHERIRALPEFPDYYGGNLDALHDVLTELSATGRLTAVEFIGDDLVSPDIADYVGSLRRMCADVAVSCPELEVTFGGVDMRAVGLAAEAARLEAAGTEAAGSETADAQGAFRPSEKKTPASGAAAGRGAAAGAAEAAAPAGKKSFFALYAADLAMLLIAFGGYFREGFGCDTLWHMLHPADSIGTWLTNGRFFAYFLNQALLSAGYSATDHYKLSYGIFMLFLALALVLFQKAVLIAARPLLTSRLREAGFAAGTALIFANVLFSESFVFTECFLTFPFAYALAGAGVLFWVRRKYVPAVLCLIGAAGFYQIALIAAAMVLAACAVLDVRAKLTPALVLREIFAVTVPLGIGFADMMLLRALVSAGVIRRFQKGMGAVDVPGLARTLADQTRQLLQSSLQLQPPLWLPALFLLACLAVIAAGLIRAGLGSRIITIVLLVLVETALLFLMPAISRPVTFLPRIVFPFYAAEAMLFVCALVFGSERGRGLICAAACVWFVLQAVFCNTIMANHFISNALDVSYMRVVYDRICAYEEETGTEVTTFAGTTDLNAPHSYEIVQYKRDQIGERALDTAPYSLLCNVSGRLFIYDTVPKDVKEKYFGGRDWDHFDPDEQLVIVGDTAYFCAF